jgi:N-acetylmuramic acid 6-phosphate etherase
MTVGGTEAFTTQYWGIEKWSDIEILQTIFDDQLASLASVRNALPDIKNAAAAAAVKLKTGEGRLIFAGAGTSARLAVQDGVELVPTYGWPEARLGFLIAGGPDALMRSVEGAEDDAAQAKIDAKKIELCANDVVVGVSASGSTPYTISACEAGNECGALTIGVANNRSPLLSVCAYPILAETGPEPIAGSTRMKAGTAQKVILNLMSTLIMVRDGRVFGGLMVDMKATNEKLRKRARRMVAQVSGVTEAEAASALETTAGDIKLAILTCNGLSSDKARELLEEAGGNLSEALERQA